MARKRIMYVELKTGHNGDGPAWITKVKYTKTEKGFYFRGALLQQATLEEREDHGWTDGNYFDFDSGKAYWASGAKKDQNDRHPDGSGPVEIDPEVKDEYLRLIGKT